MPAKKTSKNKFALPTVKAPPIAAPLAGVRAKIRKLGLPPAEVEEAIEWARKSD